MKKLVLAVLMGGVFNLAFAAVESSSKSMSFEQCKSAQQQMGSALAGTQYKVIPIVKTNIVSIERFCANDGSVIVTCSKPDQNMTVTRSTNRKGC